MVLHPGQTHNQAYSVIPVEEAVHQANICLGTVATSASTLLPLLEQLTSKWQALVNWEELSDEKLWRYLSLDKSHTKNISVITDVSYRENLGAFALTKKQVQPFVVNHLTNFGESLFNGDVIIIDIDRLTVLVFHHDGVYAIFGPTDFQYREVTSTRERGDPASTISAASSARSSDRRRLWGTIQ